MAKKKKQSKLVSQVFLGVSTLLILMIIVSLFLPITSYTLLGKELSYSYFDSDSVNSNFILGYVVACVGLLIGMLTLLGKKSFNKSVTISAVACVIIVIGIVLLYTIAPLSILGSTVDTELNGTGILLATIAMCSGVVIQAFMVAYAFLSK